MVSAAFEGLIDVKIAIYSGSFNPLHYGHLEIIKHLASREDIDKIIVVVSPKNPGKPESVYIQSPELRLAAVKEGIKSLGLENKVEASDIEFQRTPPIWTVDTLGAIKSMYPNDSLVYVAGSDCLEKIMKWRRAEVILEEIGVLIFPRAGQRNIEDIVRDTKQRWPGAKIEVMNFTPLEISSTEIRKRLENGEDYSSLTPVKL